jgi:hypothetical protein
MTSVVTEFARWTVVTSLFILFVPIISVTWVIDRLALQTVIDVLTFCGTVVGEFGKAIERAVNLDVARLFDWRYSLKHQFFG